MEEKPFLPATLCKVDRILTLGLPPCIKVCQLSMSHLRTFAPIAAHLSCVRYI